MKTRNRKRKGFTLVELLVVISIIGMLMALLLPAVQAARESGRANTCRNNLKNLSFAVVNYDTQRNIYPGYVNDLVANNGAVLATSDNHYRSWTFVLLPLLESRSVYDQFKDKDMSSSGTLTPNGTPNTNVTTTLEFLHCPSNPPEATGVGVTSYVVNVGQVDIPGGSISATQQTRDLAGNGVFHYRGAKANANEVLVSMTTAYISAQDGTPTTIMMSENADAYTWAGLATGTTAERYLGFAYNSVDGTPGASTVPVGAAPMGINVLYGQSKTGGAAPNAATGFMRPSAYHPAGANFAFCDGHVRFLRDDISYSVFQALMSPRGSQTYDNTASPPTLLPGTPGNPASPGHGATQVVDQAALQ
jgi:prepilin-type N-terminal cleavage/methylation domain-containing protein/prepilin-type processing-associated H-X9-DG protein